MFFSPAPAVLSALRNDAVVARSEGAVFRIEGPGAVDCMQGLLTGDLVAPGEDALVYGALLTPKGMIVVDAWVLRLPDHLLVVADAAGRAPAAEIFRRSLPPRLARVTDLSSTSQILWLLGPTGPDVGRRSGLDPWPAPGRATTIDGDAALAAAMAPAPFTAIMVGPRSVLDRAWSALVGAGATPGDEAALPAARVLAGWPTLGREIGERTLPQEVRYDELGGVSYSKGCYIGQETVARVHFRGHVNRHLRGVVFEGPEPLEEGAVTAGGREVGSVRSVVRAGDRLLALVALRRETGEGAEVAAGRRSGRVVPLPFAADAALRS